jgi:hypothetical protein
MRIKCASARRARPYRRTRATDVILGFGPVRIEPGEVELVVARPTVRFKGRRLAYAGPPGTFVLWDVLVDGRVQTANSSGSPMELFPPLPADLAGVSAWLVNCGLTDGAEPGTDITLVIQNVSRTSAEFSAVMFGSVQTTR